MLGQITALCFLENGQAHGRGKLMWETNYKVFKKEF